MVDARKSDINELQVRAGTQHLRAHGHIGQDHRVRVPRFCDQRVFIRCFGKRFKNHAFFFKGLLTLFQFLLGNSERFHDYNFHRFSSVLFVL